MELTKGRKVHTWSRHADFLLSCIGYAVGIGNIWRFPYLCMKNGGGAFLIPYLFFMITCGIPLFFLELSIGQFTSLSPISVWDIAPIFKGLGLAMCLLSGIVTIYLNTVITWSIYYFYHSLTTGPLPWTTCDNDWNTVYCALRNETNVTLTLNSSLDDSSFFADMNYSDQFANNFSAGYNNSVVVRGVTPAEEFWKYKTLSMSSGITEIGALKWELVVCHIVGWAIITLCLIRGIKSSGKVVYVTATIPYVFLTALLIRGLCMPGALNGIIFYIKPDFNKLLDLQIWAEACIQIFFSLGPAWGALITMASFNKFDNDCMRDACIIPLVNCGTSIYGGFVIFSIIGSMAHTANVPVDEVITSGVGLAFIAYPEALATIPLAPLWSATFFLMLLTIGLDTQFGLFETMAAGVCDHFDIKKRRFLVTIGLAIVACTCGFIFCTQGGVYVFQIIDWYSSALGLMTIAIMESLIVSWVYGVDEFFCDIEMMLGHKPPKMFKIFWPFSVPAVLLAALIYSLVMFESPTYGDYQYPAWSRAMGWAISAIPLLPIIFFAVKTTLESGGSLADRWEYMSKPSQRWGPAHVENHQEYRNRLLNISQASPTDSQDDLKIAVPEIV